MTGRNNNLLLKKKEWWWEKTTFDCLLLWRGRFYDSADPHERLFAEDWMLYNFFCVSVGTQKHRTVLLCVPAKFPWRRIYFWDHKFACVLPLNFFERRRQQYFPVFFNYLVSLFGFCCCGGFFFLVWFVFFNRTLVWMVDFQTWTILAEIYLLPQDFQVLLNTVVSHVG